VTNLCPVNPIVVDSARTRLTNLHEAFRDSGRQPPVRSVTKLCRKNPLVEGSPSRNSVETVADGAGCACVMRADAIFQKNMQWKIEDPPYKAPSAADRCIGHHRNRPITGHHAEGCANLAPPPRAIRLPFSLGCIRQFKAAPANKSVACKVQLDRSARASRGYKPTSTAPKGQGVSPARAWRVQPRTPSLVITAASTKTRDQ